MKKLLSIEELNLTYKQANKEILSFVPPKKVENFKPLANPPEVGKNTGSPKT